jgi:hypothetical protein
MNRMTSLFSRRTLAGLVALAGVAVALAAPAGAGAEDVAPQVTLGPTTILNGLAVVSGTVDNPSSGAQLTVNGQPLDVETGGSFAGVVDVNGQSSLSLALQNPGSGESSTVSIPLNSNLVGPGGLLSSDALTVLEQAGVTILKPLGGFGDTPITIGGGIANGGQLASLSVNGVDALSTLKPGGSFVVPIPGTTKEIGVLMTDKQGVSLDTTYRTTRSVSATDADGVRIAKIRYFAKGIKKTKRLRVVVTVRDRRNRLIHGAVVKLRSPRTDRILGRSFTKSTNLNGKVAFILRVRRAAFGKRTRFVTTAQTPSAKVSKRTSVRLPRKRAARRR